MAMLRAVLLFLLTFIAVSSNSAHVIVLAPASVITEYSSHHKAPKHKQHEAPCCDTQACIGCAVMPADVATTTIFEPIPFKAEMPTRTNAFVGRAALPDVPPPRT